MPAPKPFLFIFLKACQTYVHLFVHICCGKLSYMHMWSISTHLRRLTINLFTGRIALLKTKMYATLCMSWEVACTYSLSGSAVRLTAVIPPASRGTCCHGYRDGGGRSWALGLWPALLRPWKQACSAGHMALISNYSRSRDPYRSLRPGGPSNEWSVLVGQNKADIALNQNSVFEAWGAR